MLLIYIPQITPRVEYVFEVFFNNIFRVQYALTTDLNQFMMFEGAKCSYCEQPTGAGLFIKSSSLLFETRFIAVDVITLEHKEEEYVLKGFFKTENSLFPFDIFASAFYLLSRYEEYAVGEHDHHGRFHAHNSVAYQQFFLQEPMVDYYAYALVKRIKNAFPSLSIESAVYQTENTVDVDMAWKYLHKGFLRNVGGFIKDLMNGNIANCNERVNVLLKKEEDPFQRFEFMVQVANKAQIPLQFFWLLGFHSNYDKNTPITNKPFRALINRYKLQSGIHFSYGSHAQQSGFELEQDRYSAITGNQATCSRFHFLKYKVAHDFPKLIDAGIQHEYSMGYAMHEGFRASIARPFKWFNLSENTISSLTIVPFMFMDASFRYHADLNDGDIKKKIEHVIQRTKAVNGRLVALWHNDTFDEKRNNWTEIFLWFNNTAK